MTTDIPALVRAWQAGECPGEVLCDALAENGIDPDSLVAGDFSGTWREHLCQWCSGTDSGYYCSAARRLLGKLSPTARYEMEF